MKNFIIFDCSSKFNVENSFNIQNLNTIFFNWDLKFFKISNLDNFLKKFNIYSNSFISFFFNLEHLFYFLKFNNFLFIINLKLLNLCYNGFFLNLNYFFNLKFKIFSNIFILYFLNLVLNIIFNLLYLMVFKIFYILNISLLNKKLIKRY